MARDRRGFNPQPYTATKAPVEPEVEQVEPETEPVDDFPEALPVGLKEEVPTGSEQTDMKAAIKDTWQQRENGMWINSRDFQTRNGAVPQGVVRPLEEAYALEVQKLG